MYSQWKDHVVKRKIMVEHKVKPYHTKRKANKKQVKTWILASRKQDQIQLESWQLESYKKGTGTT